MEVLVPMAGIINKDEELERLDKEMGKLTKEVQRLSGKLNNDKFIANAPEQVVAGERQKLADASSAIAKLETQKERIASL